MLIFWIPEVGSSAAAEKKMANPLSLINKPIILIFFIAALGGMVRYGLMSFLPTFLGEVYGFSVVNAGLYSTIYLMAGAASTIFGGWLADRINRLQLVIFESVATMIAVIVLSLGGSTSFLLILSLVISGAFVYFAVPAYNALLSFYSSPENQGWIYGVNFGGSSLGSLVGALVIGYMADLFGFRLAFLSLAGFSLMRTAMLLIMRQISAHSVFYHFGAGSN
jgi:sugar phosphate permease